jgi:hypothetical protein
MGKVCVRATGKFPKSRNWAVPGANSDDISYGVGRICNEWTNRITTLKVLSLRQIFTGFLIRDLLFGPLR